MHQSGRPPLGQGDGRRATARRSAWGLASLVPLVFAAIGPGPGDAVAQEVSPRRTRDVEIIRRVEPGVVAIFSQNASGQLSEYGSGSVIGDGYILTNDHVVKGFQGIVLLQGMPPIGYELVGRLPEKDLALLRVAAGRPLAAIPLGRSHDLMAGEPVLAGGNPGGRGIVFSGGIVSSPSVVIGVNALAMALARNDARDRFIQFDAAVNRGNSGGPLVNAEGMLIGVVSQKVFDEDNVGYAIPIDRVRNSFRDLAAPEDRGDFWAGLTMDPLAAGARVVQVAPGGPGERSGLRAGDFVTAVDGKPLRDGLDWLLALIGRKPAGLLTLTIDRPDGRKDVSLKLDRYPIAETASQDGKSPGLRYEVYHGEPNSLADLHRLKSAGKGTAEGLDLARLEGTREEKYAVIFTGYLEIPEAGVYHLILGSDDGSRLFLDDRMVVDNDGTHPVQEVRGVRRLARGLHRMRIEYFQGGWGASLGLRLEPDRLAPGGSPTPLRFYRD
jgi:S1-C subfamily serine protease